MLGVQINVAVQLCINLDYPAHVHFICMFQLGISDVSRTTARQHSALGLSAVKDDLNAGRPGCIGNISLPVSVLFLRAQLSVCRRTWCDHCSVP